MTSYLDPTDNRGLDVSAKHTNEAPADTMKSIVQDAYGTAPEEVLRLAEIARPTIGDDLILVRVAAAGVDRGTWHCDDRPAVPHPLNGLRRAHTQSAEPGPGPRWNGRVRG